jgi:ribonuclease HI
MTDRRETRCRTKTGEAGAGILSRSPARAALYAVPLLISATNNCSSLVALVYA